MRVEQNSLRRNTTSQVVSNQSLVDARRFYRVAIHLPVAIRQQNSEVLISKSIDISEGGILVENSSNNHLSKGDTVKVHIEGILGEDQEQLVLHPMRVIRVDEETIALEFI